MNIGTYAVTNAIGYAKFYSHSHDAVIRVFDEAGNVIETHETISKEDEFIPDSARDKCNHEQDCDPDARDTDDDFVARCHCHFQLSFNFAQRITLAATAPLVNGFANSSIAIENVRVPSRSRRRLRVPSVLAASYATIFSADRAESRSA